jgi:hypothetical protein
MHTHLRIVIGVMVTLAATIPVRAGQGETAEARGKIIDVRPADRSLTIHIGDDWRVDANGNFVKAGSDLLLRVDESTQIRWGHQKAQLEKLRIGHQAFVRYRTADRHLLELSEAATLEDLKREVVQVTNQLSDCTYAQRNAYQQRIGALIELVDSTKTRFEQSLAPEAQKHYEPDLENVRRRRNDLSRLRFGIGPISEPGWAVMKPDLLSVLNNLNNAVDKMLAKQSLADK